MTKSTEAYEFFDAKLDKLTLLLNYAKTLDIQETESSELIIFINKGVQLTLCSHVETYFKELADITIAKVQATKPELLKLPSRFIYNQFFRDLISNVTKNYESNKPEELKDSLENLLNIAPNYVNFGTVLSSNDLNIEEDGSTIFITNNSFTNNISLSKFKNICRFFNRFGYMNFKEDFIHKSKKLNEIDIKYRYDSIVDVRNQIVHDGSNIIITIPDSERNIDTVRTFCKISDVLFSNWCLENLECSIN